MNFFIKIVYSIQLVKFITYNSTNAKFTYIKNYVLGINSSQNNIFFSDQVKVKINDFKVMLKFSSNLNTTKKVIFFLPIKYANSLYMGDYRYYVIIKT